jgi:hypothetical protein
MRIAIFYTQVDIRHGTVERTGTGITGFLTFLDNGSRKPEHVFSFSFIISYFLLKTRRILSQNKFRAILSIANQTNSRRNINGLADFIFTFRDKKDSEILFFLHLINRCLQSIRYIHLSIRLYRIVLGSEIKSFGIIGF